MPDPMLTGVPDAPPERTAIEGILESLRDDPGLLAISPSVKVWGPEGDPAQSPQVAPWPAEIYLPMIRVWPGNYPSRWENEGQHSGDLDLQIELICPGIHHADRFGLWIAFYRAVFPPDIDRKALVAVRIDPVGNVVAGTIRQAGTATAPIGADLYAQKTNAVLTIKFQIN